MYKLKNLLCILCVFVALSSYAQRLQERVYTLPILMDQDVNAVRRLQIDSDTKQPNVKGGVVLHLDKRSAEVIDEISLWYIKGDTSLFKQKDIKKYTSLLHIKAKEGDNILSFSTDLAKGTNFIWVTVKVRQIKNIEVPFSISLQKFYLNKWKSDYVLNGSISTHRLAVAVRRHNQENVHTSRIPGIVTS